MFFDKPFKIILFVNEGNKREEIQLINIRQKKFGVLLIILRLIR